MSFTFLLKSVSYPCSLTRTASLRLYVSGKEIFIVSPIFRQPQKKKFVKAQSLFNFSCLKNNLTSIIIVLNKEIDSTFLGKIKTTLIIQPELIGYLRYAYCQGRSKISSKLISKYNFSIIYIYSNDYLNRYQMYNPINNR
jgi:hypothetical protein